MFNPEYMPQILPLDIREYIIKIAAADLIQQYTYKYFEKRFGTNWREILNYKWTVEDLDYYCERHGILDPWYDYCDDPKYEYSYNK